MEDYYPRLGSISSVVSGSVAMLDETASRDVFRSFIATVTSDIVQPRPELFVEPRGPSNKSSALQPAQFRDRGRTSDRDIVTRRIRWA
jgi:hypothetical protein